MRIERHDVDATALAAAEAGFAERIAGDVHRMRHDEHPARGWWSVAGAFLDYLGAQSLRSPALEGKDAQAALGSAAAAALAALELTLFPGRPVDVFIDYAGVGVSYGGEFERCDARARRQEDGHIHTGAWLDGLYLAVLAQVSDHNADTFTAGAVPWRGHEGRADVALVHALMAYVFAHEEASGGAPTPGPVRDVEKCALIDMVVATLGEGDDLPGHRAALATLRALAVGDENNFVRCLAAQLEQHRGRALSGTGGVPDVTGDLGVTEGPGVTGDMGAAGGRAAPRGLLPLDAMALMALAHRRQGWGAGIESGYLPRAVVTGFAPARPRVRAYGRGKRADAVAALTEGPLEVERPPHPLAARATDLSRYDVCAAREMARFHDPDEDPKALTRDLTSLMSDQRRRFLAWATLDADTPNRRDAPNRPDKGGSRRKEDAIKEALLLGAEAGAGALRVARAEPGTEVEVSVGGTTRTLPAWRGSYRPNPHQWQQATALALVVGARRPLADCVLIEPEFFDGGRPPVTGRGVLCGAPRLSARRRSGARDGPRRGITGPRWPAPPSCPRRYSCCPSSSRATGRVSPSPSRTPWRNTASTTPWESGARIRKPPSTSMFWASPATPTASAGPSRYGPPYLPEGLFR